ncbi:MAG TPA: transglutaminase domain-containing protein [Mariprofundaceae bacterium]|nr:transglutaminase domain-containing protein [Mariprofundaceae bacterium]
MARYQAMSLDDAFAAIATGIRYEPYRSIMRGPTGTALAQAGNSADQALLLASLLKAKGYRIRFVQGTLSGKNLETLILGMYPPDLPKMNFSASYQPFNPASDSYLQQVARDHFWIEVDQGNGSWLPLDPSFPRAKIGESYARVKKRFDSLPDTMYQTLSISIHEETAAGNKRLLGKLDVRTADIGFQPLMLTETGIPRFKPVKEKARKTAVDMFGGALSGEAPEKEAKPATPEPRQTIGVDIRRSWFGARESQIAGSQLLDDQSGSEMRREWLRFEIRTPGGQPMVIERDLFAADSPGVPGKRPSNLRRFGIVIAPGPVEPDDINSYATRLGKAIDLKAARNRLAQLASGSVSGREMNEASALADRVGLMSVHLLGLKLAAESTRMTRRMASANSVAFAQSLPRIIIVSSESTSPSRLETSIDLRLDQVDAWPYPGNAARVAEHFQTARGIQNNVLESRFVERLLAVSEASNTSNLVAHVKGGPAGMLLLTDAGRLDSVEGLSPYSRQLIGASLKAGREVIIPPKPEQLAGRLRLGWWERDPATGRMIGVMDDGLHSAMTEYSVNTEKIGVDGDSAYVIGMIVGATSTETLIAAKVLEHGTMTGELVADIQKRLKKIQCLSCPEASAKASAGASISSSIKGTCWEIKKEASIRKEIGGSVKIGFCENYTNGMSCAAGLILNAYKASPVEIKNEIEGNKAEVKLPCE